MSEPSLPRGWDTAVSQAGALTITLPAVAGITHVLTAANLTGYCDNLAVATGNTLVVTSGAFSITLLTEIFQAAAAGAYDPVSYQWAGVVMGLIGQSLVISTSIPGSGSFGTLECQGYDI